ncbi:3-hydroxy-9,10-secoandrosta-1,3,5(10)-triene-9,17-dione monooxygenase reductase component [Actinocorallia herbida]|uniref:3-hydroxy-9,10-secoandrosta-1,3,5(10)-triene-9, 17-dione monooxygenase reductase component n=1 Tax=Actinocorallia herbida TaxID=58109 RepID=A0A3N1CXP6_9ACTN|nr:flavin reductase family protein [Actinocorallia herbida]ROO86025.1 3-hydroxy-9,10-secoandrosta-1,3,5(10)-triene-9,17-dione monooxygenase reductase component [Actinocorallia herbida]
MRVAPQLFREVAGHFATGVCVVTAEDPDTGPHGMTLNSLTTVSADPATLLICLNRASTTHEVVARAGRFGVNILAAGQQDVAALFATRDDDKFRDLDWTRSPSGTPLLTGGVAHLECAVLHRHDVHSHTVVIGEVITAAAAGGPPLVFHRSRMSAPFPG